MIHQLGEPSGSPKWVPLNIWLARTVGLITIFEKGVFYGNVRDALVYAGKPRNRGKFGELKGFVIGEVVWGDPRINFEFFQEDAREKNNQANKKSMRHLKKRGIRRWQYRKYLQKNPLERYFEGKEPLRPAVCSECGVTITRRRKGYRLKPTPLCQECNKT